jgi:hypothetical protein
VRRMRVIAVAGSMTLLLALGERSAPPAGAAFPGNNGKIGFDRLLEEPSAPEGGRSSTSS